MMPVIFGEVLFDCFESGNKVLGGAPFNVAWHLAAFGRPPLLISAVGDDAEGRDILRCMTEWQLPTEGIQVSSDYPTGRVQVTIEKGEPHYVITHPSAWDSIQVPPLPHISGAPFIYHGSLALRDPVSAQALYTLCENTQTPIFVDVNLRDPWWQRELVLVHLRRATWAKMNVRELEYLIPLLPSESGRVKFLFHSTGLKFLLITRGEAGASLYNDNATCWQVTPSKGSFPVVDAVGAGDAFTSVFLLGILLGWKESICLQRAQNFASSVVGIRGATTFDRHFYQGFRDSWGV
jgi:fructokinase